MYYFNLLVGDITENWESHMIISNLSSRSLRRAYKDGVRILGFDLIDECCTNKGETFISNDKMKILCNNGFEYTIGDDDQKIEITSDEFAQIYMFICKLGDNAFEGEFVEPGEIFIGGEGFSNESD